MALTDHEQMLLSLLHPQVYPLAYEFVRRCEEEEGLPLRIIDTGRTPQRQEELYQQGRELRNGVWTVVGRTVTKARGIPPQGYHPWLVALDVCPEGLLQFNDWMPESSAWDVVDRVGRSVGLLNSVPGDEPHYDYREGHSWREWCKEFPSLVLPHDYFKHLPFPKGV